MPSLRLLAALLAAAAGAARSQCVPACRDAANWCADYAGACGSDANVRTYCEKTCGLCKDEGARPEPNNPSGCGGSSPSYPPALRFSGDKVLGVAQGISGGAEAAEHSYPFLVRLRSPGGGRCTASIIGEQWVLTAAHCVATDSGRLKGAADRFTVHVAAHGQNDGRCAGVESIHFHEEYRGGCKGEGTDIAVIRLSEKLHFSDKVKPICLPDGGDDFTGGSTEKMVAAGWGWAHQAYRRTPLQHNVFTTKAKCWRHGSKEMCAWGGQGSAACPGDSGGPLFFKRGGRWTQAGIAECGSHTHCGSESTPSTYVHVPAHRQWIKQKTGL